jgi:hypothetical protein
MGLTGKNSHPFFSAAFKGGWFRSGWDHVTLAAVIDSLLALDDELLFHCNKFLVDRKVSMVELCSLMNNLLRQ